MFKLIYPFRNSPKKTDVTGTNFWRLARCLGWFLLALYFVLCLGILLTRWFFTTQINNYREDITALISQATGVQIKAKQFRAGFYYIWPTLELEDVTLSSQNGPVALTLPKINARLAWSSLWHRAPVFDALTVTDPTLTIRRLNRNTFDIAGFTVSVPRGLRTHSAPSSTDSAKNDRLIDWLFAQNQWSLINGTVTYIDTRNPAGAPLIIRRANATFSQKLLCWTSAAEGAFQYRGHSDYFNVRAELNRPILGLSDDPSRWSGRAYGLVRRADVARLLRPFNSGFELNSGIGALRAWINIDQGRLTKLTTDVVLEDVNASLGKALKPLRFDELQTRFTYETTREKALTLHRLALEDFRFSASDLANRSPAALSLTIGEENKKVTQLQCSASNIDLGIARHFLPSVPMPDRARDIIGSHDLTGLINSMNLQSNGDLNDLQSWSGQFDFADLALKSFSGNPSFSGLTGSAVTRAGANNVLFKLNSRNVDLTFPKIFRHPTIHLAELNTQGAVNLTPSLKIVLDDFTVINRDAHLTGKGSWENTGGAGTLDLEGRLIRARANAVVRYLPTSIDAGTLDWLEGAILSGSASDGQFTVRGPLDRFPWHGSTSPKEKFYIDGNAHNVRLDFVPGGKTAGAHWPVLNNIEGRLFFEGNGMRVRARSLTSAHLTAGDVAVDIPDFSRPILFVTGKLHGDLHHVVNYLKKAPDLHEILNGSFDQSRAKGDTTVTLKLKLPLSDLARWQMNLFGEIKKGRFAYGFNTPEIKDLNGTLIITENAVRTPTPLTGRLSTGPVTLNAFTRGKKINLDIDGVVDVPMLEKIIDIPSAAPLFAELQGQTPAQVNVLIPLDNSALSISAFSSLKGLGSRLPMPMTKAENSLWPLNFNMRFNADGARLRLVAPGHTNTLLSFTKNRDALSLTQGFIGIGQAVPPADTDGVQIAVEAPKLELGYWLNLLDAPQDKDNTPAGQPVLIDNVTVKAGELIWDQRHFTNIDATLKRVRFDDWYLRLNSEEIQGQIEYATHTHTPNTPNFLRVNLARLHVPASSRDDLRQLLELKKAKQSPLPNLDLNIKDLKIEKRSIGKVQLSAKNCLINGDKVWNIEKLQIDNPGATVSGSGNWLVSPSVPDGLTHLDLKAHVIDTGKVLTSLNVPDAIRHAPGDMHANLTWIGSPAAPRLDTLNGTLIGQTGAGQILQIEPGAGRLLSLLSMQHLLRRLTLDFRDVTGKGFGFDAIHFSGKFVNGIFETPKITVMGSSATVVTGGTVDLNKELLNLKTVILPSINAGGPSLALALINPAVGIGTFVTQWVLKDQISNMFKIEYDISGTFDDPQVNKAGKHKNNLLNVEKMP